MLVHTIVHVPVEGSAVFVASASSDGTPSWGVTRNAVKIKISVSFGSYSGV